VTDKSFKITSHHIRNNGKLKFNEYKSIKEIYQSIFSFKGIIDEQRAKLDWRRKDGSEDTEFNVNYVIDQPLKTVEDYLDSRITY
jgi:hypothetical protein